MQSKSSEKKRRGISDLSQRFLYRFKMTWSYGATNMFVLAFLTTVILLFTTKDLVRGHDWLEGVHVEATGFLFDIYLFGILLTQYDRWKGRRDKIERYKEEIDDYRGWKELEASYRTAGIIRRLSEIHTTRRLDLNKCHLVLANLRRTNLTGAHLYEANLSFADLTNSNLSFADLWNANLTSARSYRTNLTNANLTNANLTGAHLYEANLTNATIERSQLTDEQYRSLRFWTDGQPPHST